MSLCEICGLQPATVHLSTIVHSVSLTRHLCGVCAESVKPPEGDALFRAAEGVQCQYCGSAATVSGADQWADTLGEFQLRSVCTRCGEEYDRYIQGASHMVGQGLPASELPRVMRRLTTDAERHMRAWVTGAGR